MIDATERFSDRVENYIRYRPGYPSELFEFLRNEIGLRRDWTVADIGSGTGISASYFTENGNRVYGVEPNLAMREASIAFLEKFNKFIAVDGKADATSLPDKSVDLIFCAQAFHWFCSAETVKEFRRILKPGGFIVLAWNERLLGANRFHREFETFLVGYASDYEEVRHDKLTQKSLEKTFRTDFETVRFENHQVCDFAGLKGRTISSSYMPGEDSPKFGEMIENLECLFAEHEENGRITILYKTIVYFCKF